MNTKTRRGKEAEREALARLQSIAPGFEVVAAREQVEVGEPSPDLVVDIRFGNRKKTLLVEIKSSGEPSSLYQSASRLRLASARWPDSYPFVIAPYVSPRGREILRQSQVGFLDMLGNCLMQFDGIYVERKEAAKPPQVKRLQRSLFAPVSSRLHRVLLENADRRWTLRDLVDEADISLGLAHRVVQRLIAERFIERVDRRLALADPAGLLEAWRQAYRYSDNSIRAYHATARTPEQLMRRIAEAALQMSGRYAFTLHAGASLVAPFVRFTDVHLYTEEPTEAWVKALDLREVEFGGNLSLIEPYDSGIFYRTQNIEGQAVVADIQLYLDLYHYPARGKEQADFLRERRLKF